MNAAPQTQCAHPNCKCPVDQRSEEREGFRFCSSSCAVGDGCLHDGCRCGREIQPD